MIAWTKTEGSFEMPANAVKGGKLASGKETYIGRAHYNDHKIPTQIVPILSKATFVYGGKEWKTKDFSVLCTDEAKWESFKGVIPAKAIPGGCLHGTQDNYIGRIKMGGSYLVGMIHPTRMVLYASYNGIVYEERKNIEILIRKEKKRTKIELPKFELHSREPDDY